MRALDKYIELYKNNNTLPPQPFEDDVKKGLRNSNGTGVIAGYTKICDVIGYEKDGEKVIPIDGKLIYRGYDLKSIVDKVMVSDKFYFESIIYLLLFGVIPSENELIDFKHILEEERNLPDSLAINQIMANPSPNIMNKLAQSVLSLYSYDENPEDFSIENNIRQSLNIIAKLPTIMVYSYQAKKHTYDHASHFFHYAKPNLSFAEHILATYRLDQKYSFEEAKLLDLCLIVQADHGGGNNSAFTSRVLTSTNTDIYSTISACISSLKGCRHGGANLKVMDQLDDMLDKISDTYNDELIKEYLWNKLNNNELIYGMGHAIYMKSDPRAQLLKKYSKQIAYGKGYQKEYDLLCSIERLTPSVMKEYKGKDVQVCANVDLFTGLIYRMLDIDKELYTPIFAISRVSGWCAHRFEELQNNKIIRPAYRYIGKQYK